MSIAGAQSSTYRGLAFGAYLEKKPEESGSNTAKRSFLNLLRSREQEQEREVTGEEAADNGAFGDKTPEELVNPSDNPKATWNSSESKKLTRDQARYLKEKYNITCLSNEEQSGLVMELIDMQILTREEAKKLLLRQGSLETVQFGSWAEFGKNVKKIESIESSD